LESQAVVNLIVVCQLFFVMENVIILLALTMVWFLITLSANALAVEVKRDVMVYVLMENARNKAKSETQKLASVAHQEKRDVVKRVK